MSRERTVSYELQARGVSGVLVEMAECGLISELRCAMPECYCPGGRGYFDPRSTRPDDWVPTPDHYPLPKRKGGHLVPENIRLAHKLCNRLNEGEGPAYDSQRRKASDEQKRWLKAQEKGSVAEARWVKKRKTDGFGGYETSKH